MYKICVYYKFVLLTKKLEKPPKTTTMAKKAVSSHTPVGTTKMERLMGELPIKKVTSLLKSNPEEPLVKQISGGANMPKARPEVVPKGVSTLDNTGKTRYSDAELEVFRRNILKKLEETKKTYQLLLDQLAQRGNGTLDTDSHTKDMEDGSETLSREETAILAGRQEKLIWHLETALVRIENKTYGICRSTGRLISKERLDLVPHATLSIEGKASRN